MSYLLVFIGSGIGGLLRFGIYKMQSSLSFSFPLATLLCNLAGSVAIVLASNFIKEDQSRLFVVTGLLGGFTTYSAFVLDILKTPYYALYMLANCMIVAFCFIIFRLLQ